MPRKRYLRLMVAAAASLAVALPAGASFQPLVSPNSAAMGSTSSAWSQDSTALFLNPAGLGKMKSTDFYFMHNQLYAGLAGVGDLSEGLMTMGVPTRLGAFAVGLGTFRAGGLKQERTLSVGFGRSFGGRLQVGVAGKQLYHNYSAGADPLAAEDPVFAQGTSRSAFSFDAGLAFALYGPLTLGLAVRNINRPDIGLSSEDRVPREVQAGLSFDMGGPGLRLAADMSYRDSGFGASRTRLLPSLGLEKGFEAGRFLIRLGVNPQGLSGGFGLNVGRVGLDYALVLRRDLTEGSLGTHSLGVRFKFGGPAGAVAPRAETAPAPAAVEAAGLPAEPVVPGPVAFPYPVPVSHL